MLPFDPSTRYDRQVRLWGEEGQASIGSTSACVLGSDSLGIFEKIELKIQSKYF